MLFQDRLRQLASRPPLTDRVLKRPHQIMGREMGVASGKIVMERVRPFFYRFSLRPGSIESRMHDRRQSEKVTVLARYAAQNIKNITHILREVCILLNCVMAAGIMQKKRPSV